MVGRPCVGVKPDVRDVQRAADERTDATPNLLILKEPSTK